MYSQGKWHVSTILTVLRKIIHDTTLIMAKLSWIAIVGQSTNANALLTGTTAIYSVVLTSSNSWQPSYNSFTHLTNISKKILPYFRDTQDCYHTAEKLRETICRTKELLKR